MKNKIFLIFICMFLLVSCKRVKRWKTEMEILGPAYVIQAIFGDKDSDEKEDSDENAKASDKSDAGGQKKGTAKFTTKKK